MESETDVPPVGAGDQDDDERAGLYLAAIIALAVPALIVLAFFLSSTGSSDRTDSQSSNSGLDRVDVGPTGDEEVTVEVAGAGASQEENVSVEIGSAASIAASPVDGDTSSGATSNEDAATGPTATDQPTTTISVTSSTATPSTTAPSTTGPTTSTSTTAPTSTTTSTTSTSTTTTSTTEPPPDEEPAEFAQRIDIGRIGESTLQFRFSSATTTSYVVTVRSGATVVTSKSGGTQANQLVNETVQGLTPGTDYTVQVTLNGPPSVDSPRVSFRTSGGDDPTPADTPVAVQGLRLVSTGSTRFEVNYESNICANGSFVIREQGGAIVGSNAGQASGCTTRHLAIPGFWTAALQPNTTYVITVTVEANGAGKGGGNTSSQSLTVTTTG